MAELKTTIDLPNEFIPSDQTVTIILVLTISLVLIRPITWILYTVTGYSCTFFSIYFIIYLVLFIESHVPNK